MFHEALITPAVADSGRTNRLPLALMTAAAAVPVIVFAVTIMALVDDLMRGSLEKAMRGTADWGVSAVESRLAEDITALQVLAANVGGANTFAEQADKLLGVQPLWLGLRLIDPGTATVLAEVSGTRAARAMPPADAGVVRDIADHGGARVGDVRVRSGDEEAFVPLYVPVRHDGRTRAVLAAAVSARAFSMVLSQNRPPAGWVVAVLDRDHTIVGRNHGHDRYVGTTATPSLTSELRQRDAHFFFAATKEGDKAYTAFSRSRLWSWVVVVGAPAEAVEAPRRRTLYVLTGGGTAALLLALWVGLAVARVVTRRQHAERELLAIGARQTAERRLSDIASNLPGVIYRRVLTPDGAISYPYISPSEHVFANVARQKLRQDARYPLDAVGIPALAPEDQRIWQETLLRSSLTLEPFHFEGRANTTDGSPCWVRTVARPSRRPDGAVVWDGVVLDITDLKLAEERLEASLAEKEAMLREIHHRVRNNLQVVSSLIQIEAFQIADGHARARLADVSRRIGALGHVHELAYGSADIRRIDCGEHLRRLCATVEEATSGRAVAVAAQPLCCDLDTAIPLGLITHELVTQIVDGGPVRVSLARPEDGAVVLTVSGGGRDDADHHAGLGGPLLHALARQIDASLSLDPEAGASLRIDGRRFAG